MIIFEKVEAQNFLSIGDNPIIISLNRSPTTLITGTNGVGKSTILEAICFAMFGKSFRGITKPQLINTVNQKGCMVKLYFKKGEDTYTVLRGIKPNIFSIYKNDAEIDESASVKDFQIVLEEILGFSYNDFIKTRMVGNANYKPFLMLSGPERRTLVDSLLNLELYTKMNQAHKARMSSLKQDMLSIDRDIETSTKLWKQAKENLERIEQMQNNETTKKQEKLEQMVETLSELRATINGIPDASSELASLNSRIGELFTERRALEKQFAIIVEKNKNATNSIKFWENATTCEACEQNITHEHSNANVQKHKSIQESLVEEISSFEMKIDANAAEEQKLQDLLLNMKEQQQQKETLRTNFQQLKQQAKVLAEEIEDSMSDQSASIEPVKKEIEQYASLLNEQSHKKDEIQRLFNLQSMATEILKDTGIKAAVIKRFTPMLNVLVNEHLDTMGFGLRCYVDENFNETLKGRYKDEFNYQNLSQGERQRLDLAFLFAW